jgi:hypothetical protein
MLPDTTHQGIEQAVQRQRRMGRHARAAGHAGGGASAVRQPGGRAQRLAAPCRKGRAHARARGMGIHSRVHAHRRGGVERERHSGGNATAVATSPL